MYQFLDDCTNLCWLFIPYKIKEKASSSSQPSVKLFDNKKCVQRLEESTVLLYMVILPELTSVHRVSPAHGALTKPSDAL